LERGEQVMVGSAFQNGLDVFSARLNEAGVKHLVLDGRLSQKRRGELAKLFKQGCPRAVADGLTLRASAYPVILAGQECMAELHNFHLCNNVILTAYSWAFDKFEQFINRAHRLNSPWPVNVWSVICDGSIDRKLEAGIHEKKDAAELVLDGHLLGETPKEVNLQDLLRIAQSEFKQVKTIDEDELGQGWPCMRAALGKAFVNWKGELHESVKQTHVTNIPLWRQQFLRQEK
jgi:SNF2 family DNA or RNA helicase